MKRFLTTLIIIYAFLFGFGSLAGSINTSKAAEVNDKWGSLNSLKNVHSFLMNNGHIVRLEFKYPVSQWMNPLFYKNSVEIDFPGAFVGTANKSFPLKSPIISEVFASQSDRETLRVRFQINPDLKDIENRTKLLKQGRFMIIRFDVVSNEPSFAISSKDSAEQKQKEDLINIDDDLLSQFLPHASKNIKDKQEENLPNLNASGYSSTVKQKEAVLLEKEDKNKNEQVESSVVPLVDQIKKGVIVLGVIFLMIFGFKKYFLITTRRDIRNNKKKFSLGHSEGRGDKVLSVVSKVASEFLNSLSSIIKPKEAQVVEDAREKILQKIRKLKKVRR